MSISTSEQAAISGTSSGLSPQALYERHQARQSREHPALKRLYRLGDAQQDREEPSPKPDNVSSANRPAKDREPLHGSNTASPTAVAEPQKCAPAQTGKTGPNRQQARKPGLAEKATTQAAQKEAPARHQRRRDAPMHLADPLLSAPSKPRKRSVSEVLHLFKGKVSQALAHKKHLRPARLLASSAAESRGRKLEPIGKGRTAAADGPCAHGERSIPRQHGIKAKPLEERQANREDDMKVRRAEMAVVCRRRCTSFRLSCNCLLLCGSFPSKNRVFPGVLSILTKLAHCCPGSGKHWA